MFNLWHLPMLNSDYRWSLQHAWPSSRFVWENVRLRISCDLVGVSCVFYRCEEVMYGSIPPVTIPPGHDPRDLPFFHFLAAYSPRPGTQKGTIPRPRVSLFTHCTQTKKTNNATFCLQKSKYNFYFYTKPYHIYKPTRNTSLEFIKQTLLLNYIIKKDVKTNRE